LELTNELCFIGSEKSLQNVASLIKDAKLLLNIGSFGHSVALSMIATEECGKALILAAVCKGKTDLDKELQGIIFKKHVPKLYAPLLELALSENFSKADVEYVKTLAPTLDKVKQRGLYVDFLKGKWVTPQDEDMKEIAKINLDYVERIYKSVEGYLNIRSDNLS